MRALVPVLLFVAWLTVEVGLTLASSGGRLHP
jgi:hypothetical protein